MPNKSMTWGAVATSLDISRLNDLGICVSQDNEILYNEQFDYYIIKFYVNYGTGQVSVDTSNFYITKGYPLDVTTNQHDYLNQNQSGVNVQRGMSGPLVTYGGEHILYNPDATYTISAIDNTAHQPIDTTYFSIVEYNGNVGLHLSENSPVQVYNNVQRVDFSITTHSRVGDEVTINADLPYTTSVTSYKLRLADKYPDAVWLYFTPDKGDELIFEDTPMPLYKSDGTLATRIDYGDYELEALEPIPPYISNDGYGRFSNAVFSYATYSSTSDVLHVSFSDLYQGSEDGACITNRLRVNIATPITQTAQLGGVITSTDDSVISVPIEQIDGSVAFYGYAYPDGALLDMSWDFGGVVYEYSPAPALPTVSVVISYIRQNKSQYYTAGGTYYLYDDSGNPIPWDSINKYQFFGTYESASSTTIDSGEFYQRYQSIIESGGVVNYKNTGLGLYVQRVVFYSCNSPDATVITVYDSSNNPYNAFQYTSDGTDYYYVLDGTQTDWTDDLASIGYSLPLPNVEEYVTGELGGIASGSYKSTNLSYDSTKVYMFAGRDDRVSFVYRDVTCWEVFGNTGTAMVRNLTNHSINVTGSGMVATDKTYVTAINVYNSNGVAYPCFKFNGGQVKYWVWDGSHQYWTSDLTSIGYKLPTIGYLSSDKTAKSMNAGDLDTLYDENGTKITVSTYGVSYPAVRVYSSSSDTVGTAVVNNNWTVHGPQFSNGDLSVSNLTGSTQTIQRIAFIK